MKPDDIIYEAAVRSMDRASKRLSDIFRQDPEFLTEGRKEYARRLLRAGQCLKQRNFKGYRHWRRISFPELAVEE